MNANTSDNTSDNTIGEPTAAHVIAGMRRVESKLQQLIDALAADDGDAGDDEEGTVRSLDGIVVSRPRDENESLG